MYNLRVFVFCFLLTQNTLEKMYHVYESFFVDEVFGCLDIWIRLSYEKRGEIDIYSEIYDHSSCMKRM